MYDTVLAPTGLKVSQYGMLSELNARGAALPTVHELAEELARGEIILDKVGI
jgi:hypothetical protein